MIGMPRLVRENITGEHGAFSSMLNSTPKHDFLARRWGGRCNQQMVAAKNQGFIKYNMLSLGRSPEDLLPGCPDGAS